MGQPVKSPERNTPPSLTGIPRLELLQTGDRKVRIAKTPNGLLAWLGPVGVGARWLNRRPERIVLVHVERALLVPGGNEAPLPHPPSSNRRGLSPIRNTVVAQTLPGWHIRNTFKGQAKGSVAGSQLVVFRKADPEAPGHTHTGHPCWAGTLRRMLAPIQA